MSSIIIAALSLQASEEISADEGALRRDKQGGIYEGSWERRDHAGKIQISGAYKAGLRTGKWIWYSSSGIIRCMGNYRRGKRHGRWSWYFENGVLEKLQYYDLGRKVGSWYEFYDSGRARFMIQFDRGDTYRNHSSWYPDGTRKYRQTYRKKDDKYLLESISVEWYSSGVKRYEGYFNNGEALGPQRWYWPNGNLMLSGFAMGEKLLGEWLRYDKSGRIVDRRHNPDNAWVYSWIPLDN